MKRKNIKIIILGSMILSGCCTNPANEVMNKSKAQNIPDFVETKFNLLQRVKIDKSHDEEIVNQIQPLELPKYEKIREEQQPISINVEEVIQKDEGSWKENEHENPAEDTSHDTESVPVFEEVIEESSNQEIIVEEPIKQPEMAQQIMDQINAYRQENGLEPLIQSEYHQQKADDHAYQMALNRALWHEENGECITNHPDPFSAWVNSPEHNALLLKENNTQGVVSVYYVDGYYYYSVFRTSW